MRKRTRNLGPAHRLVATVLLLIATGSAARGDDLDSVMYSDPAIPLPRTVKTYPKGLAELWLTALDRPERDFKCRAALAIASAHESGMGGLKIAVGPLIKLLEQHDQHPAVQVSAIRALVALDARDSAPTFLRLAQSGDPELRDIVEPALARWDYRPARDVWLERLNQPPPYGRALLTAIRGLMAVREERAVPRLRELALAADVTAPFRIAAARALGAIRASGLSADAARLAGDASPRGMTDRFVAASILRRHDGDEAVRLLQGLARDAEPVVAAAALTRLAEIDTRLVLPVVATVLKSSDAGVRLFGVDALFQHPSDEHIRTLGNLLADPHPDVRVRVRLHLEELAAKWRKPVIEEGVRAVSASDWRGQEQAAILLGKLAHKPAAGRFVELLKSNRTEVLVAVAWGLRQLAVPETLPKVLEHVRLRHADMLRSGSDAGLRGVTVDGLDSHLSQLIQFLGQARYQPADPVLRALVPRFLRQGIPPVFAPVGAEARAAAIFALGMLHEGKADGAVVTLIEGRLTGDGIFGRDDERVRRLAAVSLARMQATQSLPALRDLSAGTDPVPDVVANACRWAVGRLTGKPVPPAGTIELPQRDWFLVPFRTTGRE